MAMTTYQRRQTACRTNHAASRLTTVSDRSKATSDQLTSSLRAAKRLSVNNAAATNDAVVAVYVDVRNAADCPAVDAWRQTIVDGSPGAKPAPGSACPETFGNSDIFGGSFGAP